MLPRAVEVVLEADGLPSNSKVFAGQPISASISITTSMQWGAGVAKEYAMSYEVMERREDWLVSGKRRGEFNAQVILII